MAKSSPQKSSVKEIMEEIRALRGKIDKLENIVEKRLVGEVKPDGYEKKAIAEFEKGKKGGKLEFIPLSELEDQ